MLIDPQARVHLDRVAALNNPPIETLTPEKARQGFEAESVQFGGGAAVARVEDRLIPGPAGDLRIRIYAPAGRGLFGTVVFFHGGGWVLGSLDSFDNFCRSLTHGSGCVVVSVEYRLAPEHRFPAALEDCYAAICWVGEHAASFHGDPGRLAVGGESAGGNLAAVMAQLARDRQGPQLQFQLLINPATDLRLTTTPSLEAFADGYGLTRHDIAWFYDQYLGADESAGHSSLASPSLAADLSGLPPALIITAEFDPLRDEAERYGQQLREVGVPTTVSRYDGMIHGFTIIGGSWDRSQQAIGEASAAVAAALKAAP